MVRKSNIELLRIIAMLMIVANHFSVHSNFEITSVTFINCIWLQLLSTFGKLGVNLFVLISGYFLISSKKVKTQKVLKLFLQMLFYSLLCYIIFIGLGIENFNRKDMINHFLAYPIWWFGKCYLVLYFLHPYINIFLNNLNKKSYQKLIICLTILFSIIPTITAEDPTNEYLVWFIYMYSLGAYLKKYPLKFNVKPAKYILISIVIFLIFFMESVIMFDIISINNSFNSAHIPHLFNIEMFSMEKLPSLLTSIFLFIGFSKFKIRSNKIINVISSATFGIYLIHDEPYIRKFIWHSLFESTNYSSTTLFIPYSIIIILIVFLVCLIIELLRIYIIEKKYIKLLDNFSGDISKIDKEILNSKILDRI